ncbi:MAG TPA: sulfotransferase family protein [Blastocatellia bacterium]|nr:sulfotransferase family protein [Blastocatellia bacterium]
MRYELDTIFLERYRAVYIETPKVACTSIKTALAAVLGISLDSAEGNPHEIPWPTTAQSSNPSGPLFPGLFTFAFVRNPWDRLVSCYRDKIRGEVDGYTYFTIRPGVANCLARFEAFVPGMTFEDFVAAVAAIPDEEADGHFRSQYTFVTNEEGKIAVDFIGRFERLTEDFKIVQEKIGLGDIELPWLQRVRKAAKYSNSYDAKTRQIVAERFSEDIEMFNYDFGTRLCEVSHRCWL